MNEKEIKVNLNYENFTTVIADAVHYMNTIRSIKNDNYDIHQDPNFVLGEKFDKAFALLSSFLYLANVETNVTLEIELNKWMQENLERITDNANNPTENSNGAES